jgi:hypothetical protein
MPVGRTRRVRQSGFTALAGHVFAAFAIFCKKEISTQGNEGFPFRAKPTLVSFADFCKSFLAVSQGDSLSSVRLHLPSRSAGGILGSAPAWRTGLKAWPSLRVRCSGTLAETNFEE